MEYVISNLWLAWTVVAVICLVVELSTGGFVMMCFAVGAVVAALSSLFGGMALQLAVFAIATVVSLFTVRPFAQKYLHRETDSRPSNADALSGRIGRVSQTIEAGGYGRVAIDGDDWKAESADGSAVALGERVRVVGRESIIIKVEKISE